MRWWVIALAACRHDLPDSWTLQADGIEVEISADPYALTVRDETGDELLRTAEGEGGFAALAWAEGTTHWENILSPGYFDFTAILGEWKDDWVAVSVLDEDGALELELVPAGAIDGRHVSETAPRVHVRHDVGAGRLRVEAEATGSTPRAWSVGFETTSDEGFLGFGERYNRTNQRGLRVYSWAEEGGIGTGEGDLAGPENPMPNGEVMTYYPVPFFISTRGYGFWLDTTWRNEFDLAAERTDAWRAWEIGPTLAYEVYVPTSEESRPWPYALIDAFTAETGRPMVPPAWAFGPRRRTSKGMTVDGVLEIEAMRDEDLALTGADDATHFLPKGSHVGIEDDLAAWTAEAEDSGTRVTAYYNGTLADDPESPLYDLVEEGLEKGYFLLDAEGEPSETWFISGNLVTVLTVDFTNPEATAWYGEMLLWAMDLGYSGFMYDFGEYVQPDVLTADGRTGEEFHNEFPVLYQKALYDALEASPSAGDWLAYARSGYTGASQYAPMVWAGDPAASFEDSDGLPSMVRAGVNIGISGVPNWGGDINGFHCVADGYAAADAELLTRWIEQGSMAPNMQDQTSCLGAPDTGSKATIWSSEDAKEAWRTYARLHTRLQPYFLTLAHTAHETGAPILRQVFLEHPDRVDLADVDDAFYVGPALYVAPVVERGSTTKTVTLPSGLYLDWREQTLVEGGKTVVLDAPLDKLPLLLRDGYLVPMLDPTIDTLSEEDNPDVVGPTDVSGVYDVVGLVSVATGGASFVFWDGDTLDVAWTGDFGAPSAWIEAADESELATCAACWRRDDLGAGLSRIRVTSSAEEVDAGGLVLRTDSARKIRWDVYLVE